MRGYITEEEEYRLAEIFTSPKPVPVTPVQFVRDFTELYLSGHVWTNSDKIIRLTLKGMRVARDYLIRNGL